MVKRKRNAIGQFISSASAHIGSTSRINSGEFLSKNNNSFYGFAFCFHSVPSAYSGGEVKKNEKFCFFAFAILQQAFYK